VNKWLSDHEFADLLEGLVQQLLISKPGEPHSFLIEVLAKTKGVPASHSFVRNDPVMSHSSSASVETNKEPNDQYPGSEECIGWRALLEVSSNRARKERGGNYIQIATVDANGLPRCRTVVFRGFLEQDSSGRSAMKMITNAQSDKVQQVAHCPHSEMVWWFPKSSEQYRIAGELQLIGPDHSDSEMLDARKQMWGNLSDPAREQFWWNPPGPYHPQPELPAGGRDTAGKVLHPPETFLMMLLWPSRVDYLRLTDNYHQVDILEDNTWSARRMNP
jgi:PPOX class probable FMN-dependent enzyme